MLVPRGLCRPLQPTRSTPSWHRRQAIAPAGFGLLPVRSPLLRESSLFLGVLRCFSSPGALLSYLRCPAVRRTGCPIRTSPDRRLPASPRGISPRGRVLPRPPTPRHPPCAHLCEVRRRSHPAPVVASAADRHAPEGRSPRHGRSPPTRDASGSPPMLSSDGRCPRGDPGAAKGRTGDGVFYSCVFLWLLMQCARATRHELAPHTALGVARSSRHAMSEQDSLVSHGRRTRRVPRGALSRYVRGKNPLVKGVPPCEVVKPRPKPSPDLGRDLPTAAGLGPVLAPVPGWSRGDSNPGPPPCKGGALPAKLRPPESLPPAAAAIRGGRAWTRTRDLGLIRAAL